MYSSEDLERFYFQYQTEALPHGESLQSFCVKNKVPYNIFQKWYRDTRKKVVEVQVDGAPAIGHEEKSSTRFSAALVDYSDETSVFQHLRPVFPVKRDEVAPAGVIKDAADMEL